MIEETLSAIVLSLFVIFRATTLAYILTEPYADRTVGCWCVRLHRILSGLSYKDIHCGLQVFGLSDVF